MKAVLGALVVVLAGLCQATPSVQHRVDSEAKVKVSYPSVFLSFQQLVLPPVRNENKELGRL